jgi:hypothetical protein
MWILFVYINFLGVSMKELSFVEVKEVSGAVSAIDVIEDFIERALDMLL